MLHHRPASIVSPRNQPPTLSLGQIVVKAHYGLAVSLPLTAVSKHKVTLNYGFILISALRLVAHRIEDTEYGAGPLGLPTLTPPPENL